MPVRTTSGGAGDVGSTVHERIHAIILSYARVGFGTCLLANLLLSLADLAGRPAQLVALYPQRSVLLLSVLVLLLVTRTAWARGHAVALALVGVAIGCMHVVGLGGDENTTVVLTTALAAGLSIVFPWGAEVQLAVVAIVELATLAMLALLSGGLAEALLVYPSVAVSLVLGASMVVAYVARRHGVASVERQIERENAEAALRASAAESGRQLSQLEALFRTAPVGFSLMDTALRYLRVNDMLAEIDGVPAENHVGRSVFEVLPSVGMRVEAIAQEVMAAGEPVIGLELFGSTRRDRGVMRSWRSDVWPLKDSAGGVTGLGWVVQEVTEQKRAEQALRHSEERLRTVTQATNDALWDWDVPTDTVWWNADMFTLFGYSADEVGSTSAWWVDKIHPEERERIVCEVQAAVASGAASWSAEYRYRRADGSYAWVLDRGYVFRNDDGAPIRMVGAIMDISARKGAEAELASLNATLERHVYERTAQLQAANRRLEHEIGERQQAAEALRQNQQLLHDILDSTTAIVYLKDAAGRYLFINRQFEALFHTTRSQLLGMTDDDLFPGPAADAFRENDRQVLAANRSLTFEETAPHDDGPHTYVSVKFPLFDASGAAYGVCGISTDITARKKMEADLQASQAELLTLIENTSDAIWSLDSDYRLTAFNSIAAQGFHHLYGVPLRLGERIDRHIPEAEGAYWRRRYDQVFAGETLRFEHEYVIRGESRLFLISMTPIVAAARATGATAFGKDITDLKRAQEQVRMHEEELAHVLRVHSMGEMAAALAHEINQPLGAIANYAQGCSRRIAAGSATVEELRPAIEEITGQALRAGEITRRVRQLMQKQTLPHEEVDLNGLVADAVQVVKAKAHQLGIALRVELAAELPPIHLDRIQIEQVIVNLMLNGLEAMQTTDPLTRELSVHTARSADGGIDVAVRDSGVGLSPAIAETMFDPFSSSKPSGLGMGLAISQSIVQRHGGRIWAINNAECGATFHVALPLTRQEHADEPTAGGLAAAS